MWHLRVAWKELERKFKLVGGETLYTILFEFDLPTKILKQIKVCWNERARLSKNLRGVFPV
jgi:hypothetical protein